MTFCGVVGLDCLEHVTVATLDGGGKKQLAAGATELFRCQQEDVDYCRVDRACFGEVDDDLRPAAIDDRGQP